MNPIIKRALSNIKSGRWFTVASIVVLSFSFFLLTVFVTASFISWEVLNYLESRAQITIFFKDSVEESQILSEKTNLEKDKNIASVTYTSKEKALESYISEHKGDPLLLESLTKDIFPPSLDIRAYDISYLPKIEELYGKRAEVDEVVYYKDALNAFKKFSDIISLAGLALVALLLLSSVTIVLLTVGSSIYVRNDEIGVMRLVGASNWYIQAPFLLQGLFYGVVSALISEVFFVIAISFFGNDIRLLTKGISTVNFGFLYAVVSLILQVIFGASLGLVGSWGALRRYLKI